MLLLCVLREARGQRSSEIVYNFRLNFYLQVRKDNFHLDLVLAVAITHYRCGLSLSYGVFVHFTFCCIAVAQSEVQPLV